MKPSRPALVLACFAAVLTACDGSQSALLPAGPIAREIAGLWWTMLAGGTLIFVLVLVLLLLAFSRRRDSPSRLAPDRMVVLGGIVLPVVVLSILLPLGFPVGSGAMAPAPDDSLTIRVTGHQWWWDVEYADPSGGEDFTTANELYLPVGRPVELLLESRDVIHSLWLPRLAGKLDLIPGRTNRLLVEADEPGTFRGQCAEFCGLGHAKMAFHAIAVPPDEFEEWRERQRRPASPPATPALAAGAQTFSANGCALCHTVRGHFAWGREGPDLTHVGSRKTIGAGFLANTPDNVALWIARNEALKPGNRMPDFAHLDLDTRQAIASYLESLR